jgi:hypothetical protein
MSQFWSESLSVKQFSLISLMCAVHFSLMSIHTLRIWTFFAESFFTSFIHTEASRLNCFLVVMKWMSLYFIEVKIES